MSSDFSKSPSLGCLRDGIDGHNYIYVVHFNCISRNYLYGKRLFEGDASIITQALKLPQPSETSCGSTRSTNTSCRPFGTACVRFYGLDAALPCFCLLEGLLGNAVAIASAAADSPLIRVFAEVERNLLYQRASIGREAESSGSSTFRTDSSFFSADRRSKSAPSLRSPPNQTASNATRRSASRSPLGPSSISSRQLLFRHLRPSAVILWTVRPRGPGLPWRTKPASRSRSNAGMVAPGDSPAAVFSSYGVATPLAINASMNKSRSPRRRLSLLADM